MASGNQPPSQGILVHPDQVHGTIETSVQEGVIQVQELPPISSILHVERSELRGGDRYVDTLDDPNSRTRWDVYITNDNGITGFVAVPSEKQG